MVRAVLVDLDDTLVDHRHAIRTALSSLHATDARLQTLEFDFLLAEWQRVLDAMHDAVALGKLPIHESRIIRYRHFYELAGSPVDQAEALQIADRHMTTYMASRRVVPGAVGLMETLKRNARTAIVTNNTVREQDEKLETFGLWPHVDVLVTSEECGITKPDPAIFRAALERLGVAAEEAVMVGDSWQNDVLGAAACGIRAVWLNRDGIACPDPALATEVRGLEPVAQVAALVLNGAA